MSKPTPAAANLRRRDLAAIHAAAAQLGMDTADKSPDSAYRTMLRVQGGSSSAAELDDAGRQRVLAYLRKLAGKGQQGRTFTQAQWIEQLWSQLGAKGLLRDPSAAGLAAFLRTHHGVDLVRSLDSRQASKVIEALKAWKARGKAAE